MKDIKVNNCAGFTLIEILTVFVIIAALTAIAIPHFTGYRLRAKAISCASNRYHINMEEEAYYSSHGAPNLEIDDRYVCPSGGIYVWLVSDPADPEYPKIGCSIHDAGSP